ARRRVRVELRLRADRALSPVQVVGPDRPGGRWPDPHVGPARRGAGRLGLLLHGPHRRLRHGHRPARRAVPQRRTGEGQWVDLACAEAAIALTGPGILDASINGRDERADGAVYSNRSPYPAMAPHGVYPTRGDDAWVAIACRSDEDWSALATVIGEPWAK